MPIPDPNADDIGHQSPTMTVGDLRAALDKIDPNLRVRVEGCDCEGDAGGYRIDGYALTIERTTYVYNDGDE